MQCHQCQEALSGMQARGKTVLGCKGCRYFWVPVALPAPAERRWVAAHRFAPLVCPSCVGRSLRLGSVGNRPVYRCESCRAEFAQHETGSAFAFFMEWALLGVLGADLFACGLS